MSDYDLPLEPRKQVVPNEEKEAFLSWVHAFLSSQKTLVLATCLQSVPVCNIMSFALVPGPCCLAIVTPVNSRKCRNLRQNPNVSLLALDPSAFTQDLEKGTGITLNGRAREAADRERQDLGQRFIDRNPALESFARSQHSAVFCIRVHHILAVTNFQDLTELRLEE